MLRSIFYCCIAIIVIACNDTEDIKTELPQESNDTTEKVTKVKSCDFIASRELEIPINSQLLEPYPENALPGNDELMDSATYNKYLKGRLSFVNDYDDYVWISANRVKGVADNIVLISFELKGEYKDRDTYMVAFSSDCEVLDKILVACFRRFSVGSTQKSAYIESDTIKISTVVSNKRAYDKDNIDDATYRKFYFDKDLQVFMIAKAETEE